MSARVFLDTNVLVYADDLNSPIKGAVALALLKDCFEKRSGVLSTQVLQEYFSVAVTKLGVPADLARRKVELFSSLEVFPIGVEDILGAIDLHRLHGYSFWDCLILRAALQSGCTVLYSEDLEHGRRFEGLTVVNPFLEIEPAAREKPAEYRARKSPEARRTRRKYQPPRPQRSQRTKERIDIHHRDAETRRKEGASHHKGTKDTKNGPGV